MRRSLHTILNTLEDGPELLADLLSNISDQRRTHRFEGSWTIQEWASHLIVAQDVIKERFELFRDEDNPMISAYDPKVNQPNDDLMKLDLEQGLNHFSRKREWLLRFCSDKKSAFWNKEGQHEDYSPYNPHILLRHAMLADHYHMFQIEQLWLKKI